MSATPVRPQLGVQTSLDDLGTPLANVTFVVVDLETTGGRADAEGITEIGAVKVRGGEILGEFATLVDPGRPIPPYIEQLTGITTSMVVAAPRIASVLPSFLEFVGPDAVLVAHNAPFDIGFLKAACAGCGIEWPGHTVVDTVRLARPLVSRDEAPNHKLSSLAIVFGAETTPNHRALADARATVDVLHGLLSRLGGLGVTTLEDLVTFSGKVPPARRRKAHLADALPSSPGVYLFKDAGGTVLYVGTSGNIRGRVRSYFTASEKRRGMGTMVDLAASVTPIPCATALEAHIREIRLIAEHKPRFNRRSTRPEKAAWLKVTAEPFPRLAVVRAPLADGARYVGPFASQARARDARDAIHAVSRLRQCTTRLSRRSASSSCALAEMGRCDAPCIGGISETAYGELVDATHRQLVTETRALVGQAEGRLAELAAGQRFEEARQLRDGLHELLRGLDRHQRRNPLIRNPEFIAARRRADGGWEFAAVRHGRLVGTAASPRGVDPRPIIDALRLSAESVPEPSLEGTAALPEETDVILRWLEQPGTRVVSSDLPWQSPIAGAAAELRRLAPLVERARRLEGRNEAASPGEGPLSRPDQGRTRLQGRVWNTSEKRGA